MSTWGLDLSANFDWIFSKSDTCLEYQTFRGIDPNTWLSLFPGIARTSWVRQLFYRTFPVFGKREQSTAPGLNDVLSTLDFLLLLVVDLQVLLESLLCLLTLRIILLQILAKVDQMYLDLEVTLADVLLLRLEVLLMSKDEKWGTSWTPTFAPRTPHALRTFFYVTRATL